MFIPEYTKFHDTQDAARDLDFTKKENKISCTSSLVITAYAHQDHSIKEHYAYSFSLESIYSS